MQTKAKSQTKGKIKKLVFSKKEMFLFSQKILSVLISKKNRAGASVLALYGDLGSGKTAFCQGLAKGLKIKGSVNSPTFVIYKKYSIPNNQIFSHFYHFDCYRLKNSQDAKGLGLAEIFKDPQNVVALEWPENIKDLLPKNAKTIKFRFIDKSTREITY